MVRVFFLMWVVAFSSVGVANPYLSSHEEGWYWHNEPKVERKTPKPKEEKPLSVNKPVDPDKTWKLIGKMVDRARAKAILNPTPANIAHARRLQRMIMTQANLFSERWMLDLLLHPELDESLVNPSNSAARDIYNQQNSLAKEKAITAIARTSGLLYFYQGGDPFSERMAEVVSDFAKAYSMQVLPIAMNNRFSPIFPHSRVDSGEAASMGVKHIPAVFAFNPVSKQIMPVAYGLVSQSELKENILMSSNAFQSGDYNALQ